MASAIYPKAKARALQGGLNMVAGTVKAVLVDAGVYTYSAAHEFLSDLTGIVGTAVTLSGKAVSTTAGFSATSPLNFTGLTSAPTIEAIVYYVDTGAAGTSPLVYYYDGKDASNAAIAGASGLPTGAGATAVDATLPNPIFTL
jgi:hypothetical protein